MAMDKRCKRYVGLGWALGLLLLLTGLAQALSWQTAVADRSDALWLSLALDSQGQPHLSAFDVGNQRLLYSRFDGQVWHREVVDGGIPNSAGASSALALDSQDRPHISYLYFPHEPIHHLRYARFDGTVWRIETVDPQGGGYTSIALDAQGHPHISYCDCPTGVLKYAHFDGIAWHLETLEDGTAGHTSLKLDAQGHPHISYSGYQRLRYAHFDGTVWQLETVDELPAPVESTSLVLDGQGRPHIAYSGMKYASWDGSTWHLALIPNGGGGIALALDRAEQPLISFHFGDPIHGIDALQVARFDGLRWHTETVDSAGVGHDTVLGLDGQERVHIVYNSFTPIALKYALGVPAVPPTLTLTLTGCTSCRAGARLAVQAQLTNPGPTATPVEVKLGVRQPDGTPINLFGKHLEVTLPAGLDTTVPLLDGPLPPGLALGTWSIEGTVLEPELGATLAHSVAPFAVLP